MAIRYMLQLAALAWWQFQVANTTTIPVVGPRRFDVAVATASLTDTNRLDPFAKDERARSIMVSSFSPVASCLEKHAEQYMPLRTAAFQDDKYAAYGLPNGSFQSLQLVTCAHAKQDRACRTGSFPLVLFSGALSTSRLIYSNMLQSIAAAGYLVVSIDHPYDSDVTEFPDGTLVAGLEMKSDTDLELALATRVQDIAFVRDQMANATIAAKLFPGHKRRHLNARTAVLGHSFGGAAAASAMLQDPSIEAGLNLDGTLFGDVLDAGLDRPFVLMGHQGKTQDTDPSWKAVWPQLRAWKKEFEVQGAAHYSFSDLPLITTVLGLQDSLPEEVGQVLGTIEGQRMTELMVAYMTMFLDMVFKSGSEAGLVESSADFPEVVVVA